MTISIFSRYADNIVIPLADHHDIVRPTIIIEPPTEPRIYSISTYTWHQGDRIDYLAYSAYGDETQWWRIANANPEILFWNTIADGQQIRVPNA